MVLQSPLYVIARKVLCDQILKGDALLVTIRYWLAIVMHFSFGLDFSPNLDLSIILIFVKQALELLKPLYKIRSL